MSNELQAQELQARIDHFVNFYNHLTSSNLTSLTQLYHPDVVFVDPVHQITGIPALQQYFAHAYERLTESHFSVLSSAAQQHTGFVSWQMTLRHPAIGQGKTIVVDGCSELHWHADGRIVRHRDFYDLTQMVYQHLPLIGWITAKVKQQMAKG